MTICGHVPLQKELVNNIAFESVSLNKLYLFFSNFKNNKHALYFLRAVAKQYGLVLLNLFSDYLQDFLFPPLQQLAEGGQTEPVKEGQQRQ